ncbi:MAG: flagellar biosynthesis regulator FlaF [Proteobacteria bacterium]|nr:flagellar biosynthesis regulator FlaF [Pseudomonadota bacterium]
MHPSGISVYQRMQKLSMTPSMAEAAAFSRAASLLAKAQANPVDYSSYQAALNFNQLLWTLLQADLSSPANRLPAEMKKDLLSLSLFVDKQTAMALANTKAAYLDALIDINRDLARGLGNPSYALPH